MIGDDDVDKVLAAEAAATEIAVTGVVGYAPFALLPDAVPLRLLADYRRFLAARVFARSDVSKMLRDDLAKVVAKLRGLTAGMPHLGSARHAVLLHAGLFVGAEVLMGMSDLWRALQARDYEGAAEALMLSEWGHLLGGEREDRQRMLDLCRILRTGELPLSWMSRPH